MVITPANVDRPLYKILSPRSDERRHTDPVQTLSPEGEPGSTRQAAPNKTAEKTYIAAGLFSPKKLKRVVLHAQTSETASPGAYGQDHYLIA